MKGELVSGLKNAIERGDSMEKAAQSFINAGYNPQEVREAQRALTSGISGIIYPEAQSERVPEGDNRRAPPLPGDRKKKESGNKKTWLIVVIIFVALIFLGALGYLIWTL